MLSIGLLILLSLSVYIALNKFLTADIASIQGKIEKLTNEYSGLLSENSRLKEINIALNLKLESTMALYDVNKQLCKHLDEESVFKSFYEQLKRYIEINECLFIKNEADLAKYPDCTVIPLEISSQPIGWLVANGIKQQDKFHILAQQFILGEKRALLYQRLQEMAIMDSLTEVFSRRYYLERVNEEIVRAEKFKYSFSFLMVDVDNFKYFNDHYGHLVGDALLKEVCRSIKESLRAIDLVGKYGGDEFSIILVETDKQGSRIAAERIRQSIETKVLRAYDEDLKISVSIGIAAFPNDATNITALIERADQALYEAKRLGKNRVCVYG